MWPKKREEDLSAKLGLTSDLAFLFYVFVFLTPLGTIVTLTDNEWKRFRCGAVADEGCNAFQLFPYCQSVFWGLMVVRLDYTGWSERLELIMRSAAPRSAKESFRRLLIYQLLVEGIVVTAVARLCISEPVFTSLIGKVLLFTLAISVYALHFTMSWYTLECSMPFQPYISDVYIDLMYGSEKLEELEWYSKAKFNTTGRNPLISS